MARPVEEVGREVDRATVRYVRRRRDDPGLRERMRALAGEHRRFGYRRRR